MTARTPPSTGDDEGESGDDREVVVEATSGLVAGTAAAGWAMALMADAEPMMSAPLDIIAHQLV